jgi:hypothetical protein
VPDRRAVEHRLDPAAGEAGVDGSVEQRPEGQRRVAHGPQPDLLAEGPDGGAGAGGDEQRHEEPRRELLEGVAVGEHEPAHSRRAVTQRQLAQAASGVVADEGHAVEVERVEQGEHGPGDGDRRQLRVGIRGPAVGTERPVRHDAAHPVGRQALRHGLPQGAADEEAVDEHRDRRISGLGAEDPVVDGAGRKIDGGHGSSGNLRTSIQGV